MGIKLKFLILFLSVTFIFTSGIPCASAAVPYKSYNYDSYGEVVETADIYVPSAVINGETLNVGGFMTPRDICDGRYLIYFRFWQQPGYQV